MRKIIVPLFLVLIFICSCSKMNDGAVVWFNKANSLWDGKKYTNPKKAIEYLCNAIKLQPDYPQAYYNRGNAYYGLGLYQRAIKDYTEAIRLKPKDVDAYYNRGNVYFYLGVSKMGCLDAQKTCAMGDCKLLEMAKRKGDCR